MSNVVWLSGAVKQNAPTAASSAKDIEVSLRKWFSNVRDRGQGSRKKNLVATSDAANTDSADEP